MVFSPERAASTTLALKAGECFFRLDVGNLPSFRCSYHTCPNFWGHLSFVEGSFFIMRAGFCAFWKRQDYPEYPSSREKRLSAQRTARTAFFTS